MLRVIKGGGGKEKPAKQLSLLVKNMAGGLGFEPRLAESESVPFR